MVLKIIPYESAYQNLKRNPLARWPNDRNSANRLEPRCEPGFTPAFKLAPGEKVFTIGSCFARNVESALAARGFDVVTRKIVEPGEEFAEFGPNILNNFGVPSIFNELDWALNPECAFDETSNFIEVAPDRFVDLHLPMTIRPAPLPEVRRRRSAINEVTRQAIDCGTIIMTLGITEVWFDRTTLRYLNHSPAQSVFARFPDRFELHVLDFDTSMSFLRAAIALLKQRRRVEQKVLLTVSPVPLLATFTEQDVIVANCYSKSILRVIAEAVAAEHDDADYFPSYESVTLSERRLAWRDNLHHVETSLVQANVVRMVEAYTESSADKEVSIHEAVVEAQDYFEARNPHRAILCLEPVADRLSEIEHILFYADLCVRVDRAQQARKILHNLPPEEGGWRRSIVEARVLLHMGQNAQALKYALALTRAEPGRGAVWQLLAEVRIARGERGAAVVAVKRWAEINIRSGEPFRVLAGIFREQGNVEAARSAYQQGMEREIASQKIVLDYAEFLLEQQQFEEARAALALVTAENRANLERLENLRLFAAGSSEAKI